MYESLIKPSSSTYSILLQSAAEIGNEGKFLSYLNKYGTKISCVQRLEIAESLAVGGLQNMIPKVNCMSLTYW